MSIEVELTQFEDVGVVLDWRGRKHQLLIPLGIPEKQRAKIIFRAKLEVFVFGPNYVPPEMIYRSLGVEMEMNYLTGRNSVSNDSFGDNLEEN